MTELKLEKAYAYKLNSMPRGKNYNGAIHNVCNQPFRSVVVDMNGHCFLCSCDGWLPIPVGQVQDFASLQDLFSSSVAKVLQQDVADKKFTWCAVEHCGIKQNTITQTDFYMAINIDESCNLWCPSCRRESIMLSIGDQFEKKKADLQHILGWLDQFELPITIELSGNGDPLASAIIRPLFQNYQPKPLQRFNLRTNGLLIKKQLEKSKLQSSINQYSISVDAGSAPVYTKVRCGGNWSVLLENFDFLHSLGKSSQVHLNFAVQKNNFFDLQNFVDLCDRYNFSGIVHQLDDWGTWNSDTVANPDAWTVCNGTFVQHNVLHKQHPDYQQCKQLVQAIAARKNITLTPALRHALDMR